MSTQICVHLRHVFFDFFLLAIRKPIEISICFVHRRCRGWCWLLDTLWRCLQKRRLKSSKYCNWYEFESHSVLFPPWHCEYKYICVDFFFIFLGRCYFVSFAIYFHFEWLFDWWLLLVLGTFCNSCHFDHCQFNSIMIIIMKTKANDILLWNYRLMSNCSVDSTRKSKAKNTERKPTNRCRIIYEITDTILTLLGIVKSGCACDQHQQYVAGRASALCKLRKTYFAQLMDHCPVHITLWWVWPYLY